ncbi:MAG: sulfotransferase, partial [Halioglobus sp.]|nr:sulfotransferase [Halioglobus sp.]
MPEAAAADSDYGLLSRLLHKLALDYTFIGEACFDIEQLSAGEIAVEKPVFIVGLARSGTTALLTNIYETGVFRSLTYKDMPFVLMPGVWSKLSSSHSADMEKKERAHGDGILVNAESPEAFEEVFWRTFCHDRYIHEDRLVPHKVSKDTLEKFRQFVASVVNSAADERQQRYLAKNNNNLLRLPIIRRAFADAKIIVPFRDPLQQSISLMSQHRLFCERHGEDPFSLKYMNWLAHHEFGLGHRPFRFDETDSAPGDPADINYWLSIWNNSYRHVLATADEDTYFLCFETLCEQSASEVSRLYTWAEIPFEESAAQLTFTLPPAKTSDGESAELVAACLQTYREMV